MFKRILIANRGEIACRVIKTAKKRGIHTIAVYSKADKDCPHVMQADSAYCIGDAPATMSYLNIDAIIEVAKKSEAEAIHPGYGFLSENVLFAKACQKAGIIFIGPSIYALETMGSKQLAKQLLSTTKVPLTLGYHGKEQSEEALFKQAKSIGFPVLLKAANGGGGKGMRAVYSEAEFKNAFNGAKREAMASFSDDILIIEKFIENSRHIEIQIMADNFGNVVSLFERDCSIQRRHQKIIEEAPASNLPEKLRKALATAACEVAKTIQYSGAGTIEFLVDSNTNQFYFMEMNTRLQVEHPVTEMITGLDLVDWQLQIAANYPLPLQQDDIQTQGHAIECRIYAEDPEHDFLPSIGKITFLKEPHGEHIRIDSGVKLGSEITQFYDPMIAKLITWGNTREEALSRLQNTLDQYAIGGVKTNLAFLKAINNHPKFIEGDFNTRFLEQETLILPKPNLKISVLMAVMYDYLNLRHQLKDSLYNHTFGFQNHLSSQWNWLYDIGNDSNQPLETCIQPISNNQCHITLRNEDFTISARLTKDQLVIENGMDTQKAWVENHADYLIFYSVSGVQRIERFLWQTNEQNSVKQGQLTAPMPATVVAILKNIGDAVKAGEGLMILEAMKMEHTIHAPIDGILKEIFYPLGAQVNEGAQLLALSD